MKRISWLCVVVWFYHSHHTNGSMQVTISSGTTRYTNYTEECTQRPDVEVSGTLAAMKEQMVEQGISKAWLPVSKKNLGRWEWLTGEFYRSFITTPENFQPGLDCGRLMLVSQKMLIDDSYCITNHSHYICQGTGQCIPNLPKNPTCVQHNKSSYYVYKETGNWFDARDRCAKLNQTLAVFTKAEREAVFDKIAKALGKNTRMWIGLRQKDYYLHLSNTEKRSLKKHHWNPAALCVCPEADCVLLVHSPSGAFSWRQENCTAKHPFFCMQHVVQGVTTAPEQSSWPWWFREYYWLIIIGACCVGGTLLIIIITGFCWCCCPCLRKQGSNRRENKRRKKKEERTVLVIEEEPALKTSTPIKATPPVAAPRKKPARPSLENLDQVGLDEKEQEKAHLMNNTDNESHPQDAVVYQKLEEVPPPYSRSSSRSAPEGGDDKEENPEEKKKQGRPQYSEDELLAFRRQKKMPDEYFEWIMWSLADAVVKIRSLDKRAELFDLLNVERSVCSFTVSNKHATAEDIYPLLQYWYTGKKSQKAWKDLQKIINKDYTLLKPWLDEIESGAIF